MNNRFREIEGFLSVMSKVVSQNPSFEITDGFIYHCLMTYDYTEKELKEEDISNFFSHWEDRFRNKNLNVYKSEYQKGFLQFNNFNPFKENVDCAKLYLSFPKDKIKESADMIFDYIEENNMPTASKIARRLRSDSIVLRMGNMDDAKKIIEYINSTPVLYKNLKRPNPFVMRSNRIGMAADDKMSYNSFVSKILSDYLNECRLNKTKKINLNGLVNYTNNYYEDVFVNNSKLNEALKLDNYEYYLSKFNGSKESYLTNCYQIFSLFRISIDKTKNENDYFNHLANCNNKEYKAKLTNYFREKLYNQNTEETQILVNNEELFIKAIEATYNKYGYNQCVNAIRNALKGNYAAITNDGDNKYREKIKNSISPDLIRVICQNMINDNEETLNRSLEENVALIIENNLLFKEKTI